MSKEMSFVSGAMVAPQARNVVTRTSSTLAGLARRTAQTTDSTLFPSPSPAGSLLGGSGQLQSFRNWSSRRRSRLVGRPAPAGRIQGGRRDSSRGGGGG